jgi:hypothetical protein
MIPIFYKNFIFIIIDLSDGSFPPLMRRVKPQTSEVLKTSEVFNISNTGSPINLIGEPF